MIELITAAAELPVSTAEAKLWTRIDVADDDALVDDLITAATEQAEHYTRRAIISQSWRLYLDHFPTEICLPLGKTISVDAIKYTDVNDAEQTLAGTEYETNLIDSTGGTIRPAVDKSWPDLGDGYNRVRVEFTAGIAANAAGVPERVKAAIKTHIAHMYEHREQLVTGFNVQVVPEGYDRLLAGFKITRVPV